MKKIYVTVLMALIAITALIAIPGMTLEYGGGVQVGSDHTCYALQESTGLLRYYKLFPMDNGFGIQSYFVNLACEMSPPQIIYEYQHPVPFMQDGGVPTLVLANAFMGRVYILQKNDFHLFMTVIDSDMQISTLLTNNPSLSFESNPLHYRTFRFLEPDLMILSSQGSVFLLNLQAGTCSHYWDFYDSWGRITFDRLSDDHVIMSSVLTSFESTSYLLNFHTMVRNHIYYGGWATEPISGDFGNGTYLVRQVQFGDWLHLVRTLLMRVYPNNTVSYYPLFFGGSTNAFDYTPMHTFEYVQMLGDNRFLAICTDYLMQPENRRPGVFQISGNSVVYDPMFEDLHSIQSPLRLYKLQDGYYLSYQHLASQGLKLLDIASETVSLPDSNVVLSPVNVIPVGENYCYMVTSGNKVHVYRLVEPSSTQQESLIPPAGMTLSAYPNPFEERIAMILESKATGTIRLSIYDIRGRLLRSFAVESSGNRQTELLWDGKDDAGNDTASGIYLIRATQGDRQTTQKVLKIR